MTVFVSLNDEPGLSDDDHLYLVDVGFGGACITQPLPVRESILPDLAGSSYILEAACERLNLGLRYCSHRQYSAWRSQREASHLGPSPPARESAV